MAFLDDALLGGFEIVPGDVGGDAGLLAEALEVAVHGAVFAGGPGGDGVAVEGLRLVGDDEVGVEVDGVAEALAAGAGAVGIVEGEEAGLGLAVGAVAGGALEGGGVAEPSIDVSGGRPHPLLRKEWGTRFCGGVFGGAGEGVELDFAGLAVAGFDGVDEAGADVGGEGEAVDEDEDGAVEVEFEEGLGGGELDDVAGVALGCGLVEAVVAAAAELGEAVFEAVGEVEDGGWEGDGPGGFLCCFSCRLRGGWGLGGLGGRGLLERLELDLGTLDGEEGVDAGGFGQGEEGGDDLVDGVVADGASAVEAGDGAAAGVEEAEVVVDLGGGGDGGAGVAGLVLLLDGDGGSEAVHVIDVGLFDALEELAGVGGEGLDVAALALGVDGVEGERGLAGARDAGDDGHGVVRDVDVDALEVVGAGSADGDLVVHRGGSEVLVLSCEFGSLGAEDLEDEEGGADADGGVGDVEVGPVVVDDVDFEKVDDEVMDDAVVEVADGSAEDEGEGDGGEGEVAAGAPDHGGDDEGGDDGEGDEAVADGVGVGGLVEEGEGGAGVEDVRDAEDAWDDGDVFAGTDVGDDEELGELVEGYGEGGEEE